MGVSSKAALKCPLPGVRRKREKTLCGRRKRWPDRTPLTIGRKTRMIS